MMSFRRMELPGSETKSILYVGLGDMEIPR